MKYARVGLAVAGFIVALLSIALDNRRVAWGAIALLTASLILRLLTRPPGGENGGDRGM